LLLQTDAFPVLLNHKFTALDCLCERSVGSLKANIVPVTSLLQTVCPIEACKKRWSQLERIREALVSGPSPDGL